MVTSGAEEAHVVLRSEWMMLRCICGVWHRLAVGFRLMVQCRGDLQDGYRIVFGDRGAVWRWGLRLGYATRCDAVRRWGLVFWRVVAAA